MLDYRQQRDEFNRNASTDRRGNERRGAERRGGDRRQRVRRAAPGGEQDKDGAVVKRERRRADRRDAPRRASERRARNRRSGERRRDPSRLRRFPQPDGFLTLEEREFLQSVMRQSSED